MGILQTRKIAEISLDEEGKLKSIEIYVVIMLKVDVEGREVIIKRKTIKRDIYTLRENGEWKSNLDEKETLVLKEVNEIIQELSVYEKIFEQLKAKGYELEFDTDC